MKFIEEYMGFQMPIPQTGEIALMKMKAEKDLYEKYFRENRLAKINRIKIFYDYDRSKAVNFGINVSQFPEQLNYLEIQN